MKKIFLLLVCIILLSNITNAQSNNEVYVQTRTYYEPVTTTSPDAKQLHTVTYIDGLGRSKQIVSVKASPSEKDIVTHIEYDPQGRQRRNYLPVPQQGTLNGNIYDDPLANATDPNIYGTEKIYSEAILENHTVGEKMLQQFREGSAWSNKPVNFGYGLNKAEDQVRKYETSTTWDPVNKIFISLLQNNLFYSTGSLNKNIVTDEDGSKTIEFINSEGKLILVRKILSSDQNSDTYYVYNEYNQLSFVIPPLAAVTGNVDINTLNNLCYQYHYDNKNRLVEKKVPEKGWEFMVYDKQDRLVLNQDTILGSTTNNFGKKGWIFTKYDQYNRVVYSGFFSNTASRISMQTALNNMSANPANNEYRNSIPFTLNGLDVYYTKNAFPTGSMTILFVNYYDVYPTGTPSIPAQILGQNVMSNNFTSTVNTKTLLLASFAKNIDDDNFTKVFNWYDTKARLIGTHSVNYLGGYTRNEQLLDFIGKVKESYVYHKRNQNSNEIKVKEIFEYDNQNRIISNKHQVNNYIEEPLSITSYNELGQLRSKKTGKLDDDHYIPLQTIDYKYNIRGWLNAINDPTNLGSDVFALKIKFENPEDPDYGIARYNGNISEIDWSTTSQGSDGVYRRYAYKYDQLNRLTDGIFLTPNQTSNTQNHFYDEKITYNLSGNIKTLKRYSNPPNGNTPLQIDDLVYDYGLSDNSYKLNKVTDNIPNHSGYSGGGNIMEYDNNGNQTKHLDNGISNIGYNYLNLPTVYDFNGLVKNTYKYRADGIKLKKSFWLKFNNSTEETDYLDGFQYVGGVLKFFPTSEGFYNVETNEYIYNYTDHLGSLRFSYSKADGGGMRFYEQSNYYPFGLRHTGYNDYTFGTSTNLNYNYKYNGKELQDSGMYDYGARFYMPDIGRWSSIDPLAENMTSNSPYNFSFNNPLRYIDPDGRQGNDWIKTGAQIFYDPTVTGSQAVRTKYGNDAQSITGYNVIRNGIKTSYALGQDGSITTNFADIFTATTSVYDSYNINTGAATIIGQADSKFDAGYIRETPSLNTQEGAFANPAAQLASTMLTAMQQAPLAVAPELLAARYWRAGSVIVGDGGNYVSSMNVVREVYKGEKIADLVSALQSRTLSTGVEHAIVKLGPNSAAPGARVIVSGGPHGISFAPGEVSTIFGHTHPFVTGPSAADFQALKILNQSRQYISEGFNPPFMIRKP